MKLTILYIGAPELMKLYTLEDSEDISYKFIAIPESSTADDIINTCKTADVLLIDPMASVPAKAINAMPNLKLIQSVAVGYQGVDVQAASEKGIPVCNSRAINAQSVAEQAILLMLGVLRDIKNGETAVREGRQIETKYHVIESQCERELGDCTVGIIGFGAIGRYAAAFANAFGARVLATDVYDLSEEDQKKLNVTWCGRDQLLAESDIVSLHMPLFDSTYHTANADFFAKMKKGSYLINTARGELVDNEALLEAIRSGHLAGAGLDVIESEPVKADNPLLLAEDEVEKKLLLSPHVGGLSTASFRRAAKIIHENFRHIAAGEEVIYRVN